MISVDEALQEVLSLATRTQATRMAAAEAVGLVLAEEIVSDIDSPPHDKAMMDGYAVRAADLNGDDVRLKVIEEVTAGDVPTKSLVAGQATRIMTGAPIPDGADAVVMVEHTEAVDGSRVRIHNTHLPEGGNVMPQAASLAVGQTVLAPGTQIRPIEVGVLSEVGRKQVEVFRRPRVAVMTSGNELVTPDKLPGPGQIRNSNNAMLVALAQKCGALATDLGIARDEEEDIQRLVNVGLEYDALVLSGGVSAGVLDLIPKVLADARVRQVFHKVNLKPGKPLWFGVGGSTLVFGLPGNPVSSLVCFELFARAAISKMLGNEQHGLPLRQARLTTAHQQRGNRPVYFPANVQGLHGSTGAGLLATPLPWQGSADLSTLARANCLIYFAAGDYSVDAGEMVDVFML